MLGHFSLGNIGQSKDMCTSQDIKHCDSIDIVCPAHTQISQLRAFGIENKTKSSICPGSVANQSSIELNLLQDHQCDLPMYLEKKYYNEFQKKVTKWFDSKCKSK